MLNELKFQRNNDNNDALSQASQFQTAHVLERFVLVV